MDNPNTPDAVSIVEKNPHRVFIRTVVIAVVVLAGVGLYYSAPNNTSQELSVENIPTAPQEETFSPKGVIYMSLSSTSTGKAGIYEYSIEKNILNPYYVPEDGVAFTGRFKSDSSSELLVSEFSGQNFPQIKQIHKGAAVAVTDSDIQMKRHPAYSKVLDSIVFGGKETNPEVLGNTTEFNVYLKDNKGVENKIGQGAMPVLTPDGTEVVVLRSNGLHKLSLIASSTEHIWKTESEGTAFNQQFSISPQGKYLAWTYPDGEEIYVLEVSSWTPFVSDLKYTIKTHAFWPVFSPDEKYIAFEEVDWSDSPSNARLVIMNLETQERRDVLDLNPFDQSSLFINEWR